jgi:hypothetical protein
MPLNFQEICMSYDAERQKLLIALPWRIEGAYIAGGAVTSVFTNKPINDVDVYFKTERAFQDAVASAYADGLWCVSHSARAVTFSNNGDIVQFMHFDFFPTAQDIFNAFDFTIVMGALDIDSNEFVFHDDFLKHNSQRFLRFHKGTRYPLASATRVIKYLDREYTIGKGEMLKIVLAARQIPIESWEQLADQLGGAYGEKVAVNDNKPFSIDAAIDAVSTSDARGDVWLVAEESSSNQPDNALALLEAIAKIKREPFDEKWFDEDGFPVELTQAA